MKSSNPSARRQTIEAKFSELLATRYASIKAEDSERMRNWEESMRLLYKADHYLPVLWAREFSSEHPTSDFLKPFGVGLLILVILSISS